MSLVQKYKNKQKDATKSELSQKSDNALTLSSPFTIMMKKNGDDYLFVAYSMGSSRNIVWGNVTVNPYMKLKIKFGCNWDEMSVLRKMIERRERNGFYIVSTYAKDQVNSRILGELIINAYKAGVGVQYSNKSLTKQQVTDLIDGYLIDDFSMQEASRKVASELLDDKNRPQIINRKIPLYIIEGLHHFLERNQTLASGKLPVNCPYYEDCKISSDKSCGLYGEDFEIL